MKSCNSTFVRHEISKHLSLRYIKTYKIRTFVHGFIVLRTIPVFFSICANRARIVHVLCKNCAVIKF